MFRVLPFLAAVSLMLSQACGPATTSQSAPAPAESSTFQSTTTTASPQSPSGVAVPPGSLEFALVPEESEARYRVREQLASLNFPNDAVGVTRKISGTMVLAPDGTISQDHSRLTIELASLRSDNNRRDNYLRTSILQTSRFPTAEFVPKEVQGLPFPLPASGEATFQMAGDLTVRGVTKPVTWEVKATFAGEGVTGSAVTTTGWSEFGIPQPRVAMVLSVAETFRLEFDFQFRRAA